LVFNVTNPYYREDYLVTILEDNVNKQLATFKQRVVDETLKSNKT
jgi:hypothetical protein